MYITKRRYGNGVDDPQAGVYRTHADTILKKRSRMLGITEAEVIRRAIDSQVVLICIPEFGILLYAYDRGEPVKQPKALAVLEGER